jgi:release factor glutamine methyltransferase
MLRHAQAMGLERLEAQWLLLHALGRPPGDRSWLIAHADEALAPQVADAAEACFRRRASGEPLAYITGFQEFFGLRLAVDARVLVPRADTETLVQWALDAVAERPPAAGLPRLLDLGTGSGAVALAMAFALRQSGVAADIVASDRSAAALTLARQNAAALQLDVRFLQADWLAGMEGRFDVIASNPPYIAEGDRHLAALSHEPQGALTAGADGLSDLRRIIHGAPACLRPDGRLLLEHGFDQADAVRHLLRARGFKDVGSRDDLAGIARCSGGRWPAGGPGLDGLDGLTNGQSAG